MCREGSRFDRAYCHNPTCTPARASIITGMYPSQHGAWSLGAKLFDDVPTVGELLGKDGCQMSLVGKAHFQPLASKPGMEPVECWPTPRDLDSWRKFHGSWYALTQGRQRLPLRSAEKLWRAKTLEPRHRDSPPKIEIKAGSNFREQAALAVAADWRMIPFASSGGLCQWLTCCSSV